MKFAGRHKRAVLGAMGILFFSLSASAEWISGDEAGQAAAAFLTRDGVGKSVLSGRMAGVAWRRGSLWVVGLVPSGAIVLSGSDALEPIVSFSANDFVEPEFGSAFYDRLAQADAKVLVAETPSAVGTVRHEKWISLIGPRERGLRLAAAAVNVPSKAVVVEPFLTTHWNQWQPYNDFSPICTGEPVDDVYRGRAPCGCVATAAAQVFAFWKWPKRAETHRYEHQSPGIGSGTFDIRFNGGAPLDWEHLEDDYEYWKSGYDLRGKVPESTRFPIARVILWCDNLSQMRFKADGSASSADRMAGYISDWYEPMQWMNISQNPQESLAGLRADLLDGCPVHVSIPGHAIVAHGWASDGTANYVYVNFGWGGSNDGWMPVGDLSDVTFGLRPRKTAQADSLPAVCSTSVKLNWAIPERYAASTTGFRIDRYERGTTPQSWAADFPEQGLCLDPLYATNYEFSAHFTLTSRSVLNYRIFSHQAKGARVAIEMKTAGGEWTAVSTPWIQEEYKDAPWFSHRVFLGDHAGKDTIFRISVTRYAYSYYTSGRELYFKDFHLSDVMVSDLAESVSVGPSSRSRSFTGLTGGSSQSFSVTPLFGASSGLPSSRVVTKIAGNGHVAQPRAEQQAKADIGFSSSDARWSTENISVDGTALQSGPWYGIFTVGIEDGCVGNDTALSFNWTAKGYYVSSYDVVTGEFFDQEDGPDTLFTFNNTGNQSVAQSFSFPLGALAGRKGVLRVTFEHKGSQYGAAGNGVKFISPRVTNVLEPVLPDFAWEDKTFVALPAPQILSVEGETMEVGEGFYRENACGSNVLHVTCSDTVASLKAWPSHISLLGDEDVSVVNEGAGRFAVVFKPKDTMPDRSRMILTLEARDANGTAAYKDLSLRFSSESEEEVYVPPSADAVVMKDGQGNEIAVPVQWFVQKGLVAPGASVATCAGVAGQDADADGVVNWKEYVCGTEPNDAESKLTCTITFVDGQPNVDFSPKTGYAPGYRAVLKGRTELDSGEWSVKTTAHRFFRVFVEKIN